MTGTWHNYDQASHRVREPYEASSEVLAKIVSLAYDWGAVSRPQLSSEPRQTHVEGDHCIEEYPIVRPVERTAMLSSSSTSGMNGPK